MTCMSAKCFVDTNILIYAHDPSDGVRQNLARTLINGLWQTGGGVLSTQVLQEFCVNARRKASRALSVDETRREIEDYLRWEIVVNTAMSIVRALEIEVRFNISFWDAMIIQAAQSAGATVLYSEDLSDGQKYGGVRVIDPLKS